MISAASSMTVAKRTSIALVLAAFAFVPAVAHASEADVLFKEGRALLDAKKYDEACPKLAESQKLDPGAGTLLALALCHEGQGKTATAHADLKEAAAVGRKIGRNDLANAAEKKAAAMEGSLSKLVVRMPKGEAGYEVRADGERLSADRLDAPFAVDPGEHRVEVSAKGKVSKTYAVRLSGAGLTEILVDRLESAPAPAPAIAAASAPKPRPIVVTSEPPAEADGNRGGGQRALGVIGMVAGTGAIIAGGIFAAKGLSEKAAADRVCSSRPCNEQAEIDGNANAKDSLNIAMISAAAGTGAIAVGAIVFFTAPSRSSSAAASPPKKATARLVPQTSPTNLGLSFQGTF